MLDLKMLNLNMLFITLVILFLSAVVLFVWAYTIEPNLIEVKHYKLKDEKLAGLRIVFASDFHVAKQDLHRFQKIIRTIQCQNPDIILLGGDFIKGHKEQNSMSPERIAAKLRKLKAPYGIFAVLGNHDWYIGGRKMKHALQAAGILVLENDNEVIRHNGQIFTIAGVADKNTCVPDLALALNNTPQPRILLTHSPDVFPDIAEPVNLVLAGHTHGGQIKLPFFGALLVPSEHGRRYAEGLIEENGIKMIVSKGLGTSLMPLRFNCRPEILVIEFE